MTSAEWCRQVLTLYAWTLVLGAFYRETKWILGPPDPAKGNGAYG